MMKKNIMSANRGYFDNRGMLLVEVLMAITIVSVALLAIGGLVVNSRKSLSSNDISSVAYKTAQSRIEALKSVPAKDWKSIGFTNSYQTVETAISLVADSATRDTLTNSIITKTTPTIDPRCTLTTDGQNENSTSNVSLTGIGNRMVKIRVTASCAGANQTSQAVLLTLLARDP